MESRLHCACWHVLCVRTSSAADRLCSEGLFNTSSSWLNDCASEVKLTDAAPEDAAVAAAAVILVLAVGGDGCLSGLRERGRGGICGRASRLLVDGDAATVLLAPPPNEKLIARRWGCVEKEAERL